MGKRKIFVKTDLTVPHVEHISGPMGEPFIVAGRVPPMTTNVDFGNNPTGLRNFDFAAWYGVGVDEITHACQRQIERFLAAQDREIEPSTVASICKGGLRHFLKFISLRSIALDRQLTLADVNRSLIDDFLGHLSLLNIATGSERSHYTSVKTVLYALGRTGVISLIISGDNATFPTNPFPKSRVKGEQPLPKRQRQAFASALKLATSPIWKDDAELSGELLSYVLLTVALHTGRNTTPLLEMGRDCLQPHPKEGSTFLTLWKRRGHTTNKVTLRAVGSDARLIESTPAIRTNIEQLIRRVLSLSDSLLPDAPDDIKERVWLYRVHKGPGIGRVNVLRTGALAAATKKIVKEYNLIEADGKPMRINVSRLRKTFGNRLWELLDGDLNRTSIALGNSPQVASRNYLAPNAESKKNWRFMGEILVQELLTQTIGATYKNTPVGQCADPVNGQYAPKQPGMICFSFMNCLRCKHYAVTGEDLHKLFSFYFRVLAERVRMGKRRWDQHYAYIPRLIDDYIIAEGLRRGTFKPAIVEAARRLARVKPHSFWSVDALDNIEIFS